MARLGEAYVVEVERVRAAFHEAEEGRLDQLVATGPPLLPD